MVAVLLNELPSGALLAGADSLHQGGKFFGVLLHAITLPTLGRPDDYTVSAVPGHRLPCSEVKRCQRIAAEARTSRSQYIYRSPPAEASTKIGFASRLRVFSD